MENVQFEEALKFIRYLKCLDERQQAGLCLALEGLQIFTNKEKSGVRNR